MFVEKRAKGWQIDLVMRLTLFKTGFPVDRNLSYSVPELNYTILIIFILYKLYIYPFLVKLHAIVYLLYRDNNAFYCSWILIDDLKN